MICMYFCRNKMLFALLQLILRSMDIGIAFMFPLPGTLPIEMTSKDFAVWTDP